MTASTTAKEAGLKSLIQVTELTNVSKQTLTNWFNDKPELFEVVVLGCAQKLKRRVPGIDLDLKEPKNCSLNYSFDFVYRAYTLS